MPGIESTSSRTFSPATTKRGWIRCAGDRLVSWTRPRRASVRRRRRMRVAGNGIGSEFKGGDWAEVRETPTRTHGYAALECPGRGLPYLSQLQLVGLLKRGLTIRL